MRSNRTICIFFDDLKKDAQKRIIETELSINLDYELKVKNVRVEDDLYGYDEDPDKQECLQSIHAKTNLGSFLLVWDCMDAQFQTFTKEQQR